MRASNSELGRALALTVLRVALLAWTTDVHAEITNYNRVHVGSRATLLGGAVTALAGDSASAYNNPAGYGWVDAHGISLSASLYGYDRMVMDSYLVEDGEAWPLTQDSFFVFPAVTSYVVPLAERGGFTHAGALSVVVPTYGEREEVRRLGAEADLALDSVREDVLLAGPTYTLKFGHFALGVTAYLRVYSLNAKYAASVQDTEATEGGVERFYDFTEFWLVEGMQLGLQPRVGWMYRTPRMSLGANLTVPRIPLTSSGKALIMTTSATGTVGAVDHYQDVYDVGGEIHEVPPLQMAFGAAFRTARERRLELDVDVALPVGSYQVFTTRAPVPTPPHSPEQVAGSLQRERGFPSDAFFTDAGRRWVVNASFGAELPLSPQYALLCGAYTDFAAIEAGDETLQGFLPAVDMFGATLGVSRKTRRSEFIAGVQGSFGLGTARAIDYDARDTFDSRVRRFTFMVTLGGSAWIKDADDVPAGAAEPQP